MGYRKITRTEFKYIKDLLSRYKTSRVVRISRRSASSIRYINRAVNFSEYMRIRPGKNQIKKWEMGKKIKIPKYRNLRKDYSGAVLKQTVRVREAIESFQIIFIIFAVIILIILFSVILIMGAFNGN